MSQERIGIAGAGRIGQALGRLLRERGHAVVAIAGRDPERTQKAAQFVGGGARSVTYAELPALATHILICVPDDAIESVAGALTGVTAALHTSGSRGPVGIAGAMHPLQTVATPEQGVAALHGCTFVITAAGTALEWAREIVQSIGGIPLEIEAAARPLYHAAAVMASNYILALLDAAVILMGEAGITEEQALRALAPLVRASVENAMNATPARALTGPIERGDAGTVASHLRAMTETPESVRELYRATGLHALEMASKKSAAVDRRKIEQLLRNRL